MGRKKRNLIGQKFGRLTVIEEQGRSSRGYVIWKCLCSCGNYVEVSSHNLMSGNTRSCGCLHTEVLQSRKDGKTWTSKNFENLLGQTFGQLLVVEKTDKRKSRRVVWKCLCSCGNYVEVSSKYLKSGMVKSCGCLRKKKETVEEHGMSKTPLYHVWTSMKQRCQNPHAVQYKYYGLLGVSVCTEWSESFIKFGNENDFDFIIRRVGGNAGKAYILNDGENVSSQSNYFIKNNSILTNDVLVEIINNIQMDAVNYSVGPRSLSKRELIEYVEESVKKNGERQKSGFNFEKIVEKNI